MKGSIEEGALQCYISGGQIFFPRATLEPGTREKEYTQWELVNVLSENCVIFVEGQI